MRASLEEESNKSKVKKVLPKLVVPGLVYVALVALIPIIGYLLAVSSAKHTVVDNIGFFHLWSTFFFKSISGVFTDSKFLFPGPGDFLLAAVVLLYRKRWQVSVAILAAGALLYVFGQFVIDPIATLIYNFSLKNQFGVVLECLWSALTVLIVIAIAFLPAMCAFKEKCRFKIILPLNIFLFWAQPLWIAMLFFAFKTAVIKPTENKKPDKSKAIAAASSRLWSQRHEQESKKRKGFKKK